MDENALVETLMSLKNVDDVKNLFSQHPNLCKYIKKWYKDHTETVIDVDKYGNKKETKIIGNRTYVTMWYKSGTLQYEEEYKDEKREGKYIEWRENGEKAYEGEYKNGKKEGIWTTWYSNGKKWHEQEYKDGKKEGKWTWWWEGGNKMYEREYKNDKKCGIWKMRDMNGKLELQTDHGPCGKVESISPRKKNKKAISQKKCAVQGKMKNKVTGECRRKCKVGKEKIGSDGKCTKR